MLPPSHQGLLQDPLYTIIMKLIILCAVLGMAMSDSVPAATAFASVGTSYKYDLPGGYASFSSHTPYAAAHVLPLPSMEKDKPVESEDKQEYDSKPEAAPFPFPIADKEGKVFYTHPFQYKPDGAKSPIYYIHSAFGQAMPEKAKEETTYESGDKTEKPEDKPATVYTHPFYLAVDPSTKTDEKKQVYYYPYAFPGYKPAESSEKYDEKKQVYSYTFPAGFKFDSSDEKKQMYYYYPSAFPTVEKYDSSDKSEEKKPFYIYPYGYPITTKLDSSEKSDEKKPFYYYPYTFPSTYKFGAADKTEMKTPLVYYTSPYYFPKTETTYKFPTYTPQYYYYHSY